MAVLKNETPLTVCQYDKVDAFDIPQECPLQKLPSGRCSRCPHNQPEAPPVEEDVAEAWQDIKPKPKEKPEKIRARVQELLTKRRVPLNFHFFALSEREKVVVLSILEWVLGRDSGAIRMGQREVATALVQRLRESNSPALQDGIQGPRHMAAVRGRQLSEEERWLGPGVTDPYPEPLPEENEPESDRDLGLHSYDHDYTESTFEDENYDPERD